MKRIFITLLLCGCYHATTPPPAVIVPPPTYMNQPLPYLLDKTTPPRQLHPHNPNLVWVWIPAHMKNGRMIAGHWEQRKKPVPPPVVYGPRPPIKKKPPLKPKPKKKPTHTIKPKRKK